MSSFPRRSLVPAPRWLPVPFLLFFLWFLAPLTMAGQSGIQLRTVRGVVVDTSNAPIGGAVVYLKNIKTLAIRTYISPSNGHYRFSGLDPNVDYEIHAEHQNLTSASHTISSFNSNSDIVVQLKVDRRKSSH